MQIVKKPWGKEIIFASNPGKYLGKILKITKGQRFSYQYHEKKDETMYILKGRAAVTLSNIISIKNEGDCIHIPHQTIHRVMALEELDIIEVSTYFPSDTIRLSDDYGRV